MTEYLLEALLNQLSFVWNLWLISECPFLSKYLFEMGGVMQGSSLKHSASESSLRGGSATALELAEESGQRHAASVLRNASVSEFEKHGMWGKPENDGGSSSGG